MQSKVSEMLHSNAIMTQLVIRHCITSSSHDSFYHFSVPSNFVYTQSCMQCIFKPAISVLLTCLISSQHLSLMYSHTTVHILTACNCYYAAIFLFQSWQVCDKQKKIIAMHAKMAIKAMPLAIQYMC